MLEINGTQHLLSTGEESPEGVTLLSSNAHEAKVFCHGNEYTLYINQTAYASTPHTTKKSDFAISKKLVVGEIISSKRSEKNEIIKYTLKSDFKKPSDISSGQGAIWISSGNKLLRFDIKKEAWSVFDSSYGIQENISSLAISDKHILLATSKTIKRQRSSGIFSLDIKAKKLQQQLNTVSRSYQFSGKNLWFLDNYKGLGVSTLGKNTNYRDALLDKNTKEEYAYNLSINGNDIWYSHHAKNNSSNEQRLNGKCVSHYNIKNKTYESFTRKDMDLNPKHNCAYLAASNQRVWVSHRTKNAGLSMFNIAQKKWQHISSSANNSLIGGQKILLHNNKLWMTSGNQLLSLDTETRQSKIILGDAIMKASWYSDFHVSDGYVWYVTKEKHKTKPKKTKFVLYKVPIS